MNWENVYVLIVWVGIFVYLWQLARSIEEKRLKGRRPPSDTAKLIGIAAFFAALFAGVLLLTTQTAAIARWRLADVNIPGAVAVLLSIYLIFALGLAAARRSEGAPTGRSFHDAAKLLGAALGLIAAMALVLATLGYFDVPWKGRIWIVAIIGGGISFAWEIIRARVRRSAHPPATQRHAE